MFARGKKYKKFVLYKKVPKSLALRINYLINTIFKSTEDLANEIAYVYKHINEIQKNAIKLNDNEKLTIESIKLTLMEIFLKAIPKQVIINPPVKNEKNKIKLFGYVSSIFGTVFAGMNGYFVGSTLFTIFTTILNPIAICAGVIFGALQSLLFIGIDIRERKSFGISIFKAKPIISIYRKQLETTKEIHKSLLSNFSINQLSEKDYVKSHHVVDIFHEDIYKKNIIINEKNKDTFFIKTIKNTLTGLSALTNIGSGMLFGKSCLILFGLTALVSNPISLAISLIAGLFSVATFMYFKKKSIFNLANYVSGNPQALKKSQDDFINGDAGIKYFNNEMSCIISGKNKQNNSKEILKNKINQLEKKVDDLSCTLKKTTRLLPKVEFINKKSDAANTSYIQDSLFYSNDEVQSSLRYRNHTCKINKSLL
jgi:hypothetical protein